jgi:branched-chain amino acid transport system substrate-binding protein
VAQSLVDKKVAAVVGHLTSGASIPASRIYSDAGILQVAPTATNPAYTLQGFKTTYRLTATDAQQGPALAAFVATKLKAKKVAIVDDASTYGQGLADQFEKAIKAQGVSVVAREATTDKAVDFRAILTKIKADDPDVIMFGGADASAGPFAKQSRQLGLRASIVGGDGICSEGMAGLSGDAIDKVYCSEAGSPIGKMPGGSTFQERYNKRYNAPVQVYAPYNYDAVNLVVDAMKRANSTDPAKILAVMQATKFRGITSEISFDSKGDVNNGVISMFHYVNTKKTPVE